MCEYNYIRKMSARVENLITIINSRGTQRKPNYEKTMNEVRKLTGQTKFVVHHFTHEKISLLCANDHMYNFFEEFSRWVSSMRISVEKTSTLFNLNSKQVLLELGEYVSMFGKLTEKLYRNLSVEDRNRHLFEIFPGCICKFFETADGTVTRLLIEHEKAIADGKLHAIHEYKILCYFKQILIDACVSSG